jgi:hypothetical protein
MKTVAVIFWSLLLALFWATTSFADTGSSGGALDHITQRNVHVRLQIAPTEQSVPDACDTSTDCAQHVEHSCQGCLYLTDSDITSGQGGRQFIATTRTLFVAPDYTWDILDPPRI